MTAAVRARRVGYALVVVYALVAIATVRLSGRHVRPLFDGFGPQQPYHWVKPPKAFAATNQKPSSASTSIGLDNANGSAQSAVATGDGQASLTMVLGSAAPHPPDTSVLVTLTPLDPGTLGALPPGLVADGNAYDARFTYEPSRTPITTLARGSDLVLLSPTGATTLLSSTDGRVWQKVPNAFVVGNGSVAAVISAAGYYLNARPPPPGTSTKSGGGNGTLIIVIVVGGAVAVIVVADVLFVGARRRRAARRRGARPRDRRRRR